MPVGYLSAPSQSWLLETKSKIGYQKINDLGVSTFLFSVICDRARTLPPNYNIRSHLRCDHPVFQGLGVTRCKSWRFQQEQREDVTHGVC